MKLKSLLFFLILLSWISGFSQKIIAPTLQQCATDELMNNLIKSSPEAQARIDDINRKMRLMATSGLVKRVAFDSANPIIIPTVIYVVHDGTALINISDAQVQSQITALNNNFIQYGIKFCLATKTETTTTIGMPSGAVQTTPGIIHVNNATASAHLITEDSQKYLKDNTSVSTVTPDKFLKIWVVKSINGTSSGVAGYSLFPGMSPIFDGVVMRYDVFGDISNCSGCNLLSSNNQGKILVHEIGHYLALFHTFQGGCNGDTVETCDTAGDMVCDTPQVSDANDGCPNGMNSCGGLPDDINNFMDYTNDSCRNEFTIGQVLRMFNTLNLYRSLLFSNDNLISAGICGYSSLISATFTPSAYQACASATVPIIFTPLVQSAANTTYAWNFGDPSSGANNTSSSATTASHLYQSATGSPFMVTLTLTRNGKTFVYTTKIYITNCASALQSGNGNWYFPLSNGLKFNTGVPVVDTSIPAANTFERCSAVQNTNAGVLQFYTNGVKVWNANHAVINTTTNLLGSTVTRDGVISVPIPGSTSYYIFTKAYGNLNGFRRSQIDVSGSTFTIPAATINQPISSLSGMTGYLTGNNGAVYGGSAIAASQSCNGYWVFTTLRKSTGSFLVVFSLTSTGLTYADEIALPTSVPLDSQEQIRISPNGNKIVFGSGTASKRCILFDFDKFSGDISNQIEILVSIGSVEGIDFSPDSNLLYVSDIFNAFYQINLNSSNPIVNRKIVSTTVIPRTVRVGPDEKLYFVGSNPSSRLGVIHNPNNLVTETDLNACNFTQNGPLMPNALTSGSGTNFALPNFVSRPNANSVSAYLVSCNTYKFFPNVSQAACYTAFSWNFGDVASGSNNTSTLNTPTHIFSGAGTYTVTLRSSTNVFIAQTMVIITNMAAVTISGNITACLTGNKMTNHSINLPDGQKVLWTVSGGAIQGLNNQQDIDVVWSSLPGTVSLTVTNAAGCTVTSTQTITSDCDLSCLPNLSFTTNEAATIASYQAAGTIVASGNYLVNSGSVITMQAGNSITFSLSSEIKAGSNFTAKIAPCPPSARKNTVDEPAVAESINIYPNPTNDWVTISTSGEDIKTVMIVAIDGKLIANQNIGNSSSCQFNMCNYQKGIYILTVETKNGSVFREKVIKN